MLDSYILGNNKDYYVDTHFYLIILSIYHLKILIDY